MTSMQRWRFFRAGGLDQVRLERGADLQYLEHLDQKLWVALACPTSGLEIDRRTLDLIDHDKDGRIRAPELIDAVKFAVMHLRNPDDLLKCRKELPLDAISRDTDEGRVMAGKARQILRVCGKEGAATIAVEDLADPQRFFPQTEFNGDGILPEGVISDPQLQRIVREIKDCVGSQKDRSGSDGIGRPELETFFTELREFADWQAQSTAFPEILVLGGEKTAVAAMSVSRLRTKIDDFFTRCRLAAFEPRILPLLNRKEEEYSDVVARDLSLDAVEVAGFPLAQISAGRALPLTGAVNPAYASALESLRQHAVVPLLGVREQLTETDWARLVEKLSPFAEWMGRKKGARVERLGLGRVHEILSSESETQLRRLFEREDAVDATLSGIENVERLVRYYRDLYLLCQNFVNFRDFYDGDEPAVFQCGTLYIDQRACRLCLRVEDSAKHASMAGLAGAYLAYADCRRPATGEKMQIVAVLTAGDSDNLMIGRNGLFYDRQGRDWDATVTKIVDSPISIRQAFWAPYKKFVRMVEQQVVKRAAAADGEAQTSLSLAANKTASADKAERPAKKIDVGAVAALGVAVGALGTFITAVVGYATGILKLGFLATLGALGGVVLLISTPSVILAYITLRKRNLGPILDASGWAVNANAKVSVSLGRRLTSMARLPAGSRREVRERFADPGMPWKRGVLGLLLLVAACRWVDGSMDRFLPERLRATTIVGKVAPWIKPSSLKN